MKTSYFLLATVLLVSSLSGQDTRGQILGRVIDPSGAVVVGAKVSAVNTATNVATSATTNTSGDYSLPFLISGAYNVTVEMSGFRKYQRMAVIVDVGQEVTIDVSLAIGNATETVSVTGESPLVDTATADTSLIIDGANLRELPIRDGNPVMLAFLSPGVANMQTSGALSLPFDNGNASLISVNGAGTGRNEYTIDGAPNTGGQNGSVAFAPPSGAISEIQVQTNRFDAGTGFSMGGSVNVNLKSGGNQLHGEAYTFIQNPALNANAFFSNLANTGKDNYREVRAALTGSGPVYIPHLYDGRNRTFWMNSFEHINANVPHHTYNLVSTVPTAPEMQGDFSSLLALGSIYQIYDPLSTTPASTAGRYQRTPIPGNLIPVSRLDKTALNILKFYPVPNTAGSAGGVNNYSIPSLELNRYWTNSFRVDHIISDKNRIFVRGTANGRYQDIEKEYSGISGYDGQRDNRGFGIDDVHTFSSTFLLEWRYNYTRYVDHTYPGTMGFDLKTLGFSQNMINETMSINAGGIYFPKIAISGYGGLGSWTPSVSPSDIHATAFDFTKIVRSHAMHFGGEFRMYRDNNIATGNSTPTQSFSTNYTRGPLDNSATAPIGQGLASFELGIPTSGSIDVNTSYAQEYRVSGWYLQDAWKATRRLTVNVGLRWEFELPTTERYNRTIRGFDPNATIPIAAQVLANYAAKPIPQVPVPAFKVQGGVTFAGIGGQPSGIRNGNSHNLAPRVSFAYALTPKTVVRAGYGIFYDLARQSVNQTGFSRSTSMNPSPDNGQTYTASLENPFPDSTAILQPYGTSLGSMTNVGNSVTYFADHLPNQYMQRWQFGVQRSIGRDAIFELGYVGSRSVHGHLSHNLNFIPAQYLSTMPSRDNATYAALTATVANPFYPLLPGTGLPNSTVAITQLMYAYPQFTGLTTQTDDGYSWYHSMQARYQKRFGRGVTLLANYTWSKMMEATTYFNASDLSPTHSISGSDRPHRIAISGFWDLPIGQRRQLLSSLHGVPQAILGGWTVKGIYQWQQGGPLAGGNWIYYGSDIHNIALPAGQRTIQAWFNTSQFEKNSGLQLVDNLRTFPLYLAGVRTPGLNNSDLGISKRFHLGSETRSLEIRGDAYNALNHSQFQAPSTSVTSSGFGGITATSVMPRTVDVSATVKF